MGCVRARTMFITRAPQVSGRMKLSNIGLLGGHANLSLTDLLDFLIMVYVFVLLICLQVFLDVLYFRHVLMCSTMRRSCLYHIPGKM